MNKTRLILVGIITGISLTVGFLWIGSITNAFANREQLQTAGTPTLSSDEGAAGWKIKAIDANDEVPPAFFNPQVEAPIALPTRIPGETLVYFFTTDSDATATILYLLNTDSVLHVVALRGYSATGVLGYSLNINVPATSMVRLTSDSVAAAPPPSWATPAPIVTNFTDFTYFASLSLPKGVKVEGYTLFNPGTGTVDPRQDQGAMPIRFSTDPATVFLPSVQSNP